MKNTARDRGNSGIHFSASRFSQPILVCVPCTHTQQAKRNRKNQKVDSFFFSNSYEVLAFVFDFNSINKIHICIIGWKSIDFTLNLKRSGTDSINDSCTVTISPFARILFFLSQWMCVVDNVYIRTSQTIDAFY